MKKAASAIIFIIFGFILQTTVFPAISFGGIIPNILVVLAAAYGFMYGDKAGLLVGFFGGLLCDVFFGSFIGLNAVIYMYIGYLNGKFSRFFFEEDLKMPLILITVSDLVYSFAYYAIMFLLRGRFDIPYYFRNIMVPELIYTLVASLLLYPLLLAVFRDVNAPKNGGDITFV